MEDALTELTAAEVNTLVSVELVRANRAASRARETQRALLKNWGLFEGWCRERRVSALPVDADALEAFLLYLADAHVVRDRQGCFKRRGLRPSSVAQALWAVNVIHRLRELPSPGEGIRIQTALAGIRRRKGVHKKQQAPLTLEHLGRIVFPDNLRGKRNKALLLVGFAGCFRRSELTVLKAEGMRSSPHGLQLFLPHSKTDQESAGAWVDIVYAHKHPQLCAVRALQTWLQAAKLEQGPLFPHIRQNTASQQPLSAASVDSLVKKIAREAGEDPSAFGGHSLRAGGATYLAEQQQSPFIIAKHGRWKNVNSALQYARHDTARALAEVF